MDVRLLGTHGSGRGQPLAPSPLIAPLAPLRRHYGPFAPLDPHARGGARPDGRRIRARLADSGRATRAGRPRRVDTAADDALTPGASPGNIDTHPFAHPPSPQRGEGASGEDAEGGAGGEVPHAVPLPKRLS